MPHAQHNSNVDIVSEATSRDEPLFQCIAYKATRLSEIVCKRTVTLFRDRVTTTHQDFSGEKCWLLDRSCKLEPEYTEEISIPEKRSIRPPGTWTVTAKLGTVTGSGQPIELYCVTINWPTSWLATRGYASFTLGFETAQEAAKWHAHVQRQLSQLRLQNSSKGDTSAGHSSKPSYDDRSITYSGGGLILRKHSQDKGFIASALEHWLGNKEDRPAAIDETGLQPQSMHYRMPTSPVQIPIPSRPSSTSNIRAAADADEDVAGTSAAQAYGDLDESVSGASFSSSNPDQYAAAGTGEEQRWVPYRHTNGVAIYHHKESKCSIVGGGGEEAGEPGSEYMASSIVRGSPDECLAVLMDMSSNTTILGPASKIELVEDREERQVLRFAVEATGMARHLCAPREVIVERVSKREECGVDVILFSSCEPPPASPRFRSRSRRTESAPGFFSAAVTVGGKRLAIGQVGTAQLLAAAAFASAAAALMSASAALLAVGLLLLLLAVWCGVVAAEQRGISHSGSSKRSYSPTSGSTYCSSRSWREWLNCVAAGGSLMWYKPVKAYVQGGYTISPREDSNGINSPECLVTCILKVDLGGCLGERSWLRPFAAALGWVDAYVERMLMAVILVKDEVEQRRFLVQPFSMLTNTTGTTAEHSYDDAADSAAGNAVNEQQITGSALRHKSSKWRQQQNVNPELSMRWLASSAAGRQTEGLYNEPYGQEYAAGLGGQQQGSVGFSGSSQLELQAGGGSAELARQASRKQQKQKGRLGRMASRIYALRPRVLRGSDRAEPQSSSLQSKAQLYKTSLSFNGQATAPAAHAAGADADAQYSSPFAAEGDAAAAAAAGSAAVDLSDPKQLLASAGLPADTVVVEPSYYLGGPQGPAAMDSTLNTKFWSELHTPGTPAPFKLRGARYLEDRTKIDGGTPQFVLGSVDLVETPGPTKHISRYLPAVRNNQAAYSFVVNLIIPGTPVLSLVAVFINEHHPDILDGPQSSSSSSRGSDQPDLSRTSGVSTSSSMVNPLQRSSASRSNAASSSLPMAGSIDSRGVSNSEDAVTADSAMDIDSNNEYQRPADTSDWQPFDYCLHRFLHGGDDTRTSMFKLIPHIAEGSWVIKQSVGTVPVILGTKLKTEYYQSDRYIEACVDVTSSSAAAYITGMVRGATKSLVIDLGFVLEGQQAEELPEALLGAFRLNHLDCTTAKRIDTSREIPLQQRPLQHHQLVALQQQAQQGTLTGAASTGAGQACTAAAEGSAAALSWQSSELPSSNGAAPAAETQQQGMGKNEQQQLQQLQHLAQQLQQRCRNSIGVVETGRTMTGHARSRSAASVDELMSSSNSPRAPLTAGSKLQPRHMHGSNLAFPTNFSATTGGFSTPRQVASVSAGNSSILAGSHSHPPGTRTSAAAVGAAGSPSVPAGGAGSSTEGVPAGSGSFVINATPAKQLFSNLLNFADRGSGSKSVTAANITDADVGHAAASPGHGHSSSVTAAPAAPQAYGPVSSLSTANSGAVTPTGAQQRGGHHRNSSNSEGRGTAGPGWPASPPTASDWSSKMSAAAYISRAHASALAASAQRRSHSRPGSHSAQPAASPGASQHGSLAGDLGTMAATAHLSVSPSTGGAIEGPISVNPDGATHSWISKRPRTSSTGSGMASLAQGRDRDGESHLQQQQQQGCPAAADRGVAEMMLVSGGSGGPGSAAASGSAHGVERKISATEQLRLTQNMLRASSASGGQQGAHHHSPGISSSASLLGSGGAGIRQGSAVVHATGAAAGPQQQLQQQPRKRGSHRRFASMGAV